MGILTVSHLNTLTFMINLSLRSAIQDRLYNYCAKCVTQFAGRNRQEGYVVSLSYWMAQMALLPLAGKSNINKNLCFPVEIRVQNINSWIHYVPLLSLSSYWTIF